MRTLKAVWSSDVAQALGLAAVITAGVMLSSILLAAGAGLALAWLFVK